MAVGIYFLLRAVGAFGLFSVLAFATRISPPPTASCLVCVGVCALRFSGVVLPPVAISAAELDSLQRVVIGAGINYAEHRDEVGVDTAGDLLVFPKPVVPTGPYAPVRAGMQIVLGTLFSAIITGRGAMAIYDEALRDWLTYAFRQALARR